MDAHIDRHQPLITARLIFAPKAFPPPPIISAWMEFPLILVPQQYERSPTPEVRTRRPPPINTERAVALEGPESPLTPAPDESNERDSEDVSTKIQKPLGMVGRPQSGGYNLQDKLGWNDTTYQSIVVSFVIVLRSILKKLTESGAQTGKDEVRHCKKFPWTGYEKN